MGTLETPLLPILQRLPGRRLASSSVYKHSVLVGEAVTSALDQETDFRVRRHHRHHGCPMAETHQACLISSLPRRIACASGAKRRIECGAHRHQYVLGAWETVQATISDADNRLLRRAAARP
jgi:hypothetical protein